MPVILTTAAEVDLWLAVPAPKALELQRPLPDDALRIVASGEKEDRAAVLVCPHSLGAALHSAQLRSRARAQAGRRV